MTPEERALLDKVNYAYDVVVDLHTSQGLALNEPLVLCAYDAGNDISMVLNLFFLPGRKTPKDIMNGEDYTAVHLVDKPTLTLVPKDTK